MASTAAVVSPIGYCQEYTTHDLNIPVDLDHYQMAMSLMPPTPPSSFDCLPHRIGGYHPSRHDEPLRLLDDDCCNSVSTGPQGLTGMMDVMADNAQLFEVSLGADPTKHASDSFLHSTLSWRCEETSIITSLKRPKLAVLRSGRSQGRTLPCKKFNPLRISRHVPSVHGPAWL